MSDNKLISKKHQPKGLEILYEDRDIIVVADTTTNVPRFNPANHSLNLSNK